MRIAPLFLLLLTGLGGLPSCSTVNVEQQANVNYSKYRTFAWAETEVQNVASKNPLLNSPLAESAIKSSIETELAKRGITRATGGRPAMYVTYHLYVDEAERTVANPPGPAYPVSYPYLVRYGNAIIPVNYTYWYRPLNTGYRTETYTEGTLVLDFIDAKTNNLFWRGSVADPINNPARFGEKFASAARDILDKFPVKAQQ